MRLFAALATGCDTESGAYGFEVQDSVLRFLEKSHKFGGEESETFLVSAGGLRLQRVSHRSQFVPSGLQIHEVALDSAPIPRMDSQIGDLFVQSPC